MDVKDKPGGVRSQRCITTAMHVNLTRKVNLGKSVSPNQLL